MPPINKDDLKNSARLEELARTAILPMSLRDYAAWQEEPVGAYDVVRVRAESVNRGAPFARTTGVDRQLLHQAAEIGAEVVLEPRYTFATHPETTQRMVAYGEGLAVILKP